MELTGVQAQLADILHVISQGLLAPVIVLLLGFIGYALFCIGSIIAEAVNERKNFRVETPKFLRALMESEDAGMPKVIEESGLLNRQKMALLTVYDYRTLPGDALVALIRRLVNEEEAHYRAIVDRNNASAKISPMIGLMGTLIPLGPGIAALGQADTAALSSSLLIAFDTTVAGLIVAAICLAIGKIRSNWYDDYLSALDASMATMLQKIELMKEQGIIEEQEPTDYAMLFELGLKEAKAAGKKNAEAADAEKPADEAKPESAVEQADDPAAKAKHGVLGDVAEEPQVEQVDHEADTSDAAQSIEAETTASVPETPESAEPAPAGETAAAPITSDAFSALDSQRSAETEARNV